MKALKVVVIVVAVAAAVASVALTAGASLPFLTAAAGAGGLGLSVAAISAIATGAALLSAGLNVIAPPRPKGQSAIGSATDWRADPSAGKPIAFGRTFFGGNIVARGTYGTSNAILASAIVWSLGPVNAIEAFTVERTPITFTAGNAVGTYHNFMWLSSQLGATPEAAALAPTQGTLTGWGSSSKLSGLAASFLELKFDKDGKVFASGFPQIGAVIQGVKCYDPRSDSTYPGGSGTCRSNDQSTWIYSTNPYVQGLTFAIGWVQNGKRVAGVGWPIGSIDVGSFVSGANVADANGWTGGGMGSTLDSKWDTLKALLQAGGGEPVRLGGLLSCNVQTPRTSLATINAADLVGEGKIAATQPRRDRFNTAVPRYRSEDHGWEVVSADPITVSSYATTDGGTRTKELDYPFVQSLAQAAQLAAYDITQSREFGPITLQLKPKWIGYKPGDAVTVTIAELGLSSQKCVIVKRTLDPGTGMVTFELRSETDAKHSFALGTTTTAPPTPTLTPAGTPFVVTTADDLGIPDNAGTGYTARVGAAADVIAYEFGTSVDSWQIGNAISSLTASGGILTIVSSGIDPWIERTAGFAGGTHPRMRARFRSLTQNAAFDGSVFYATGSHGYSGSFRKSIATPPGWANGDWVVAEWDMAALSVGGTDWTTNTISSVRVDMAAQAVTVEVDWIAFGDFADTAVMKGVEDNADVTANHQVTVELTASRTYEADYLGTIATGLPDTVSPRVTRGGVSYKINDGTTYAITTSSGVTATVDSTIGSASKGDITITAFAAQDGWVDLTVTVGGVAQPAARMAIRKNLGAAPATGGSSAKTASTGSFGAITATSFTRIAFIGTVVVASGESLYGSASLDYYITGTNGTRTSTAKLRYAPTGTTTWTDIGTAATGSACSAGSVDGEGFYEPASPGHLDYTQTATPSAGTYDVEIVALQSASGRTMSYAGSAGVEAKV